MLNNLKKRTKRIYVIMCVFTILTLFSCAALVFMIAQKNAEMSAAVEQIQSLYVKKHQDESTKKIIIDTANERDELNARFTTKENLVSFIEDIEQLGAFAELDLELHSVDVGEENGNPVLIVRMNGLGSWYENMFFMTLLETYPAYIDIRSLKLLKQQGLANIDSTPKNNDWIGMFEIYLLSFLDETQEEKN